MMYVMHPLPLSEEWGPDPSQDDNRTEAERRIRYGNNRKKLTTAHKKRRAKLASQSKRINRK